MGNGTLKVMDKFSGEVIQELPSEGRPELRRKIHHAYLARGKARFLSFEERIAIARWVGERIASEKEEFINLMVRQVGQARKFATRKFERTMLQAANFNKLIDLIRPREIPAATGKNTLVREPYGVVAVITPRNTPLIVPF